MAVAETAAVAAAAVAAAAVAAAVAATELSVSSLPTKGCELKGRGKIFAVLVLVIRTEPVHSGSPIQKIRNQFTNSPFKV